MDDNYRKAETGVPAGRDKLMDIARRVRSHEFSAHCMADEIEAVVRQHLHRRKPVRVAAPSSSPMTPELKRSIRHHAFTHPHASYMEMGRRFNVSSARVSETLAGRRT